MSSVVRVLGSVLMVLAFLVVPLVAAPPSGGSAAQAAVEPAPEAPATDAPADDQPATEAPATDAPATDAPATEAPATDAPAPEAPSTEAPADDQPATDAPAVPEVPLDPQSADIVAQAAPGCGAPCTFVPATGRAAAQWLLNARDQGKFTVDSAINEIWDTEIGPIANGTVEARCDIDKRVLQALVVTIKAFGSLRVSDLNRWCANDGDYTCTGEKRPPSPWHCRIPAVAVDFSRVGGRSTNGWNDGTNDLLSLLNQFMPANTHVGQLGCYGRPSMASLGYSYLTNEFSDSCNHQHIDIGQAPGDLRVSETNGPPIGGYERAEARPGGLWFSGWAVDLDSTGPVQINIVIDGQLKAITTANLNRPDVASYLPGYGAAHGYGILVPTTVGSHKVCVHAMDTGGDGDTRLGCSTLTMMKGKPVGSFDTAYRGEAGINVTGWAIDPDTTDPIDVVFYVNNRWTSATRADKSRTDVGQVFPGYGAAHAFSATVPVTPGTNQVCAYAVNTPASNDNPLIGCHTINMPPGQPVGSLDTASGVPRGIQVSGWALDPDTKGPIDVVFYVDNVWTSATRASGARSDIARLYPSWGPNHAFTATVPAIPGSHRICGYAVNTPSSNDNPLIGCHTVTVPNQAPVGKLDGASAARESISVRGWSLDPDTANPIDVVFYVDGVWTSSARADGSRGDVAAAYPGYGDKHGFTASVPAKAGSRTVCAYGVNWPSSNDNTLLGCSTVTIASTAPFGALDSAKGVTGGIQVNGWTIDPDTKDPISVVFYVDDRWTSSAKADQSRNDVAAQFPAFGDKHGYSATVPATKGSHKVCAYGVNTPASNDNPQLGCATVTVP
ncbi:hypothetical protein SCB71_14890 [Herbiconiux sp. KACC 21604]|uniref:hypothetical protein n=1 Tax=unclassified Herbiconiux TaxID=2618217 RepID=UPI0014916DC6|nr:hypothetical protein [Herbiconiux sp. SALV-R1]QJU54424.1 hypothetical protein HL652_12830 [Herbiconiux sp. SALV-R1]WPO85499.1 hypothetical protein SCB71_14890 [Herbiconiux sp. KACC 21604]